MSQFQLPVAVTLGAFALFSAALFAFSKPVEGRVVLPEIVRDATSHDPFDVTKPEDVIDGEPVDEDKFWSRVCSQCSETRTEDS